MQVKVTILAPDEYLLPDMNARVLFLKDSGSGDTSPDLPRIPGKGTRPGSDLPAVFLYDGQSARLRTIQIGEIVGDNVQVRKGLKPEEKILLPLGKPLEDGKPVYVRVPSRDR